MKDKIIFWLDASITHFGISYYLQKQYNCEQYAIIDITNKPKKFFQNQKIVNFNKTWFLHDHINSRKKPDIDYLVNFEKKYKINLWELACNDRIFYYYNDYYKFSRDEILSILEDECKLFENILNEVKPDFFITQESALRHHHLFYLLCRAKDIKVLMLNFANFGLLCYISQEHYKLDFVTDLRNIEGKNRNFNELLDLLKANAVSKQHMHFGKKTRNSKLKRLKAAIQFLIFSDNSNTKTHYTYFGRSKIRVLIKEVISFIKRNYREYYINKKFSYEIDSKNPFVYFPLHQEPERSLLIVAPFYTNQLETIRHIAKSLPANYQLYVKEHPTQGPSRDWRKISVYEEMMKIPNVIMLHPSIPSESIMKKCSLVISVGGTSAFEVAFYEKPSIIFTDLGFDVLPSVYKIESLVDLHKIIKTALETKVQSSDLDKYIAILEENSFYYDYLGFELEFHNEFYYGGFLVDVEIPEKKMQSFLETHKQKFELLVLEHIKKINQFNDLKIKNQTR